MPWSINSIEDKPSWVIDISNCQETSILDGTKKFMAVFTSRIPVTDLCPQPHDHCAHPHTTFL
jgi:hypothetical protein